MNITAEQILDDINNRLDATLRAYGIQPSEPFAKRRRKEPISEVVPIVTTELVPYNWRIRIEEVNNGNPYGYINLPRQTRTSAARRIIKELIGKPCKCKRIATELVSWET